VTARANLDAEGKLDLLAFVFCDRNRQYFISSCSNISPGPDEPVRVDMSLDCPKAAAIYYSTCGKIDQHNRCRQDTLKLEKKIETKQWDHRVMELFEGIMSNGCRDLSVACRSQS
jgi:hypothetical protein